MKCMPLVFKHVLNPRQKPGTASPFSIVTALVDKIDFSGEIHPHSDIRMSGLGTNISIQLFFLVIVCNSISNNSRSRDLGGEKLC